MTASVPIKSGEVTKVFYGVDTVVNIVLQFLNQTNAIIYACVDQTRPVLAIDIPVLKDAFLNAKKRGIKLRYVTEITKDNISYCKQLLTMVDELRHLNGIRGNFYISETEYLAPATFHEKEKPASQIIYSNVKEIIEHQKYVFDSFWSRAITAEQRIKEIEEGVEPISTIEIIQNPEESIKRAYGMVNSSEHEVLRIFSSLNAFCRHIRTGIMHLLKDTVQRRVDVKILIPAGNKEQIIQVINQVNLALPQLNIRSIDLSLQSSIGILVVDREESLIIETKDDTKYNSYTASGLAAYSNSKPIALSYASIFESLWKQSELYEQLKVHDKMQKDFINVAAHELRTPIQPILGLTELLRSKINDNEQRELLDVTIRNAKRLHRLVENILDITKIESQSLHLKKERFDLNEVIMSVLAEYGSQFKKVNNVNISFLASKGEFIVHADKGRIAEVISNLLGNAIKFTQAGGILISSEMEAEEVIICIRDTGIGIDSEIMPRLFTKFGSKSFSGTGLGLFISKSIIEAHGGRIWAENNPGGKGATFSFTLPIDMKMQV